MQSDLLTITAVDTNILGDIFFADPDFGPLSKSALQRCRLEGSLIACEVVWAEIVAAFSSTSLLEAAMGGLTIGFSPMDLQSCLYAGNAWKEYRKAGGSRQRMIADFLIGSHALKHATRLLTRDRGFYRKYFPDLIVLDPTIP
jgi:predicted nucleic acid-binding protein